jgi:hypothetical protein
MNATQCADPVAWHRKLVLRLTAHLRFKLVAGGVMTIAFFTAYFLLQRFPVFAVTEIPVTSVDRIIGVHPNAVFLYLSLWLYIPIYPWLTDDRRELVLYCRTLGGLCLLGIVTFFFSPTSVPPLRSSEAYQPALHFLDTIDGLMNACPSLHATFAVFSGLCNQRLLRRLGDRGLLGGANWIWCGGILYATLATKQHVLIDMICGGMLGILGCWAHLNLGKMPRPTNT